MQGLASFYRRLRIRSRLPSGDLRRSSLDTVTTLIASLHESLLDVHRSPTLVRIADEKFQQKRC
jgi:hypothetical protein